MTNFPLQTPDPSDPNFSPLVIGIIGILAAAFLLVTYYTIASKYCAAPGSSTRGRPADSPPADRVGDDAGGGGGVEESLVKSMAVCRYRKGEGVMGITGCSVCLNEFQQDEFLRLLPKCCHAFHVHCIDTWLQTHSNCPLCRANILPLYPLPPPAVATAPPEDRRSNDHACVRVEELKQGARASSAGDGKEHSRGEGEVSLERAERGEGSSMASGGGGEKMSKKSHGRASSTGTTMAIDRPASTSSVEGLPISNRSTTVINLS